MALSPPTFEEQDLLALVRDVLSRELPITEGPYELSLRPLPEAERGPWDGQEGPVLRLADHILVSLNFKHLTRWNEPAESGDTPSVCPRDEKDLARVEAMLCGWACAARRVMKDVAEGDLGDKPWLGLTHMAGALRDIQRAAKKKMRTAADFEAAFLEKTAFRGFVLPPADVRSAALQRVDAWLDEHPVLVQLPTVELWSVSNPSWGADPATYTPNGLRASYNGLFATIRLIVFELDEAAGEKTIRDIKEQEVVLLPLTALTDIDRAIAFLDGWTSVLPRAVEERFGSEIEVMMPHDFFLTDVLALKTPRTAEDFAAACARRWKLDPK